MRQWSFCLSQTHTYTHYIRCCKCTVPLWQPWGLLLKCALTTCIFLYNRQCSFQELKQHYCIISPPLWSTVIRLFISCCVFNGKVQHLIKVLKVVVFWGIPTSCMHCGSNFKVPVSLTIWCMTACIMHCKPFLTWQVPQHPEGPLLYKFF